MQLGNTTQHTAHALTHALTHSNTYLVEGAVPLGQQLGGALAALPGREHHAREVFADVGRQLRLGHRREGQRVGGQEVDLGGYGGVGWRTGLGMEGVQPLYVSWRWGCRI